MKLQECIKKAKGHELLITWNIPMVLLSVLIAMDGMAVSGKTRRWRDGEGHKNSCDIDPLSLDNKISSSLALLIPFDSG
jgi:hypothetical protein